MELGLVHQSGGLLLDHGHGLLVRGDGGRGAGDHAEPPPGNVQLGLTGQEGDGLVMISLLLTSHHLPPHSYLAVADVQEAVSVDTLYPVPRLEREKSNNFVLDFHLKCSFSIRDRRRSKTGTGDTDPETKFACSRVLVDAGHENSQTELRPSSNDQSHLIGLVQNY